MKKEGQYTLLETLSYVFSSPFVVLETRLIGNKKTYKSLICRFLSSYCPLLSSRFCGETGSITYNFKQYHKLTIYC